MGCWNETDALTKLPIISGENIVLIVLESLPERFHKPARFLSDALYSPVGLPFYGTYDDYGSIDLHESKADYHQRFVDLARSRQGKNNYETAQSFLEAIASEDVQGAIGGVYTKMMFKQSVWETLLTELGNRRRRMYGPTETYRQYFEATIDEYLALEDPDWFSLDFKKRMFGDKLFVQSFWSTIMPYLDDENGVTDEVRENVVRLLLTDVLLRALRSAWSPQFGSGSQDEELELTKTLHTAALEEISAAEKRYSDDEY